ALRIFGPDPDRESGAAGRPQRPAQVGAAGHELADAGVDPDRVAAAPLGLLAVQELLDGLVEPALAVDLGDAPADRVDVDDVGLDPPRPQPGDPRPGRCRARRPALAVAEDGVERSS